jgi:hypothetical protein
VNAKDTFFNAILHGTRLVTIFKNNKKNALHTSVKIKIPGTALGVHEGTLVGRNEGLTVGINEGALWGLNEGIVEGGNEGMAVGSNEGVIVGRLVCFQHRKNTDKKLIVCVLQYLNINTKVSFYSCIFFYFKKCVLIYCFSP